MGCKAHTTTLNRIHERMVELGMKQYDLCREVPIAQSHLSRIMCGKITPSIYVAARIADGLDVTVDWLFKLSRHQ